MSKTKMKHICQINIFFGGISARSRVELHYWCCGICVFLIYPCHYVLHTYCIAIDSIKFWHLLCCYPTQKMKSQWPWKMSAAVHICAWCTILKDMNFWHHHCDNPKSYKVEVPQPVQKLRPMQWRSQVWDLQLSQTWCIKLGFVRASVGQYASCGVPWLRQSVASLLW